MVRSQACHQGSAWEGISRSKYIVPVPDSPRDFLSHVLVSLGFLWPGTQNLARVVSHRVVNLRLDKSGRAGPLRPANLSGLGRAGPVGPEF